MLLAFLNCQCFDLFVSFEHLKYRLFNALPCLVRGADNILCEIVIQDFLHLVYALL